MNLRSYVLSNIRFGDAEMNYDGDGGFLMNIKGYFFNVITLGFTHFVGKRYF
jgi:hypothetical protein